MCHYSYGFKNRTLVLISQNKWIKSEKKKIIILEYSFVFLLIYKKILKKKKLDKIFRDFNLWVRMEKLGTL